MPKEANDLRLSQPDDKTTSARAQLDLLSADPDLQRDAEQRIKDIEQGHVGGCAGCEPPKKQ